MMSVKRFIRCGAVGCDTNSRDNPTLKFLRFPLNPERYEKWCSVVGINDGQKKERHLCERHFSRSQFRYNGLALYHQVPRYPTGPLNNKLGNYAPEESHSSNEVRECRKNDTAGKTSLVDARAAIERSPTGTVNKEQAQAESIGQAVLLSKGTVSNEGTQAKSIKQLVILSKGPQAKGIKQPVILLKGAGNNEGAQAKSIKQPVILSKGAVINEGAQEKSIKQPVILLKGAGNNEGVLAKSIQRPAILSEGAGNNEGAQAKSIKLPVILSQVAVSKEGAQVESIKPVAILSKGAIDVVEAPAKSIAQTEILPKGDAEVDKPNIRKESEIDDEDRRLVICEESSSVIEVSPADLYKESVNDSEDRTLIICGKSMSDVVHESENILEESVIEIVSSDTPSYAELSLTEGMDCDEEAARLKLERTRILYREVVEAARKMRGEESPDVPCQETTGILFNDKEEETENNNIPLSEISIPEANFVQVLGEENFEDPSVIKSILEKVKLKKKGSVFVLPVKKNCDLTRGELEKIIEELPLSISIKQRLLTLVREKFSVGDKELIPKVKKATKQRRIRKSSLSNRKSILSNRKSSLSNRKSNPSNGKNSISNGKNNPTNRRSSLSNQKSSPSNRKNSLPNRKKNPTNCKSSLSNRKSSPSNRKKSLSNRKNSPSNCVKKRGRRRKGKVSPVLKVRIEGSSFKENSQQSSDHESSTQFTKSFTVSTILTNANDKFQLEQLCQLLIQSLFALKNVSVDRTISKIEVYLMESSEEIQDYGRRNCEAVLENNRATSGNEKQKEVVETLENTSIMHEQLVDIPEQLGEVGEYIEIPFIDNNVSTDSVPQSEEIYLDGEANTTVVHDHAYLSGERKIPFEKPPYLVNVINIDRVRPKRNNIEINQTSKTLLKKRQKKIVKQRRRIARLKDLVKKKNEWMENIKCKVKYLKIYLCKKFGIKRFRCPKINKTQGKSESNLHEGNDPKKHSKHDPQEDNGHDSRKENECDPREDKEHEPREEKELKPRKDVENVPQEDEHDTREDIEYDPRKDYEWDPREAKEHEPREDVEHDPQEDEHDTRKDIEYDPRKDYERNPREAKEHGPREDVEHDPQEDEHDTREDIEYDPRKDYERDPREDKEHEPREDVEHDSQEDEHDTREDIEYDLRKDNERDPREDKEHEPREEKELEPREDVKHDPQEDEHDTREDIEHDPRKDNEHVPHVDDENEQFQIDRNVWRPFELEDNTRKHKRKRKSEQGDLKAHTCKRRRKLTLMEVPASHLEISQVDFDPDFPEYFITENIINNPFFRGS